MLSPTSLKAPAACYGNRGWLAAAVLACVQLGALATENHPVMPPEKEPAPWQRAGIEAALSDPAASVQLYALSYCKDKKWVVPFHFSTEQWLKWLALSDGGMQPPAAEAAVQLGAQTPPEVQRELLRLLRDESVDFVAKTRIWQALWRLGGSMIPEAQMETALLIQKPNPSFMMMADAYEAVQTLGPAMTPATQESLLSFIQNPQADETAKDYAADALARVGVGMQPQVRKALMGLLLDAGPHSGLRSHAAEAMGRLGPQMPPQALAFLLSTVRDPRAWGGSRSAAAHALALLGPHMPPEVQQALLAACDKAPPENADADTRNSHLLFQEKMMAALAQAGPEMPVAFQQRLVSGFLKSAHAARKNQLPVDGQALRAVGGVRPQPDSAAIHALLEEFQDREATEDTLSTLAEQFFQPLADRGALPPEVPQALLMYLQDEKAGEHARCLAAETLGHLGASATPVVKQALLALLQARSEPHGLYASTVLAMQYLGPHMPPEAAPALAGILRRNTRLRKDPRAAAALAPTPDPFLVNAQPQPGEPALATDLEKDTWSSSDGASLEFAVRALGNLGEKMTPEAQEALLEVIEYQPGNHQPPWDAAYSLAQMGDKLPPQTQQRLLSLQHTHAVPMENALYLAMYQTLGVSGIHPVSDSQVADLLTGTYRGGLDPELRFYLYLWLGRTPAHLQAVRWLGRTDTGPPLGDTPPQEVLGLISRLWPHSAGADAGHAALRQAMARRTSQMMAALLKAGALDEPTRKVLTALSTQLAEDTAADCATALREVQAALAADAKGR